MRAFFAFWYDFVVGDDWFVAVAAVAAIALTWSLAQLGIVAWPVMLVAVPAILTGALIRRR